MTGRLGLFWILATSIAAATFGPAEAAPRKRSAVPSIPLSSVQARCPTAVADEKRRDMEFYSTRPLVKAPTAPLLRSELLRMAREDQSARIALIRHGNSGSGYVHAVKAVDAENLAHLKAIFRKYGFPTPAMVGYDGINAAFLLVQHQDQDPAWQRKWLGAVTQLARHRELSPESYALFVDRVRVNEGRKQIYGSQLFNGGFALKPTRDPAHLDERREALGLIPEDEYECILRAMYIHKPTQTHR